MHCSFKSGFWGWGATMAACPFIPEDNRFCEAGQALDALI